MKAKWFISTFVVILTFLGVYKQPVSVPNQEIVMQFIDNEVTPTEIRNAIAIVKAELEALGIDDVTVREDEEGRLKISYYSTVNISSVKKTLHKEQNLELGYISNNQKEKKASLPSEENKNSYNLDIYEIQSGTDIKSDLDGKYVLELNKDYDQFSNPNVYLFIQGIDFSEIDRTVKVAYKLRRNIAIAIDNNSRNIPEVRAGPIA